MTVWRVLARVRGADAATAVLALLDDLAGAVSAFEITPKEWRVEAYPPSPVLTPALAARLALTAAAAGGTLAEIGEEKLPARDWLAENQLAFPPLRVGRFFIYGSHHRGRVPSGAIGIMLDAATAFGTGEHPSTRGCLMALDDLSRRQRFRRPLDVGTEPGFSRSLRQNCCTAGCWRATSIAVRYASPGTISHATASQAWCGSAGQLDIGTGQSASCLTTWFCRTSWRARWRCWPATSPGRWRRADGRYCRDCCAGRSRSCSPRTAAAASCSSAAWSSTDGRP